jgi:dimethylglycine dehydrogenase
VLLEKNELTAGSTWHAAGNVPDLLDLLVDHEHAALFDRALSRAGEAVDYPMNYHVTGSIRLAHSKERMQEFERAAAWAATRAWISKFCRRTRSRRATRSSRPMILEGALYDPNDGDIDPAQLTQALAKGARDMGREDRALLPGHRRRRENGEWIVQTPRATSAANRGQCGRLLCAARRRMVQALWRAHGADDGDEPPIHAV